LLIIKTFAIGIQIVAFWVFGICCCCVVSLDMGAFFAAAFALRVLSLALPLSFSLPFCARPRQMLLIFPVACP